MLRIFYLFCLLLSVSILHAAEFHVSPKGDDANAGNADSPLRTIQQAANLAQPGDIVTVHEGVYRERVNPPRGGNSDDKRIVYQAARGEKVVIKGSEIVKNWTKTQNDTWRAVVPNSLFGDFNPFATPIRGDWFNPKKRVHHVGAVYLDGNWLVEAAAKEDAFKPFAENAASFGSGLWFAEVSDTETTIWAQFKDLDPNERQIEINVRQSVFYPDQPGRNYITVRGFTMCHAASPWAPPTSEQIGLIGTHWSKGWIIENNTISHSICTGITLGKHGDEFDNTSAESAESYVETIKRAHAFRIPWTRDAIGQHVVRGNTVSHCEQAGIVGSMGAAFCTVTDNTIHDIHVRRLFGGAEMAGIKFHGAIDTLIARNHIYRTYLALWLDWMTQGTRISCNLFHDNGRDLFVEVNHGPFLVDNNIMVSGISLQSDSRGGAYVHNLFAGAFRIKPLDKRLTPFHKPHSTDVVALHDNPFGDDRYYNNVFIGSPDLTGYDEAKYPVAMSGNVFLNGAKPSRHETVSEINKRIGVTERANGFHLDFDMKDLWDVKPKRKLITTEILGETVISKARFENPDGSTLRIDTDYFGKSRSETEPTPGPFENPLEQWPLPLAGMAKE